MSTAAQIPMLDKNGNPGLVPADRVDAARAAGYQVATKMVGPKGELGYVSQDKVDAARQAGYVIHPDDPAAGRNLAKPVTNRDDPNSGISDNSYNLAGTAYGAVAPKAPPKPAPGYQVNLVDNGNGPRMQFQYPAGQRQIDPSIPEHSTDDQGNRYYQGNKLEVMGEPLMPVPGVGMAAGVMGQAAKGAGGYLAKTGAAALKQLAPEEIGKTAVKAGLTALAIKLGLGWLKGHE